MLDILTPPPVGHNRPPVTTADEMAEKARDLIAAHAELMETGKTVPAEWNDDDTEAKASELIKKMRATELAMDKLRDVERDPFGKKYDEIGKFFKFYTSKMEDLRKAINDRSAAYKMRKAEAEKRKLAEEAEKKRAEEQRLMRLAQDAEETKNDAKRSLEEASRLASDAVEAKRAAITEQEIAAADLAEAKAAMAKVKADNLQIKADIARKAQDGTPVSDAEKETLRADAEAKISSAKASVEECEAALKAAREAAIAARDTARRAQEEEDAKQAAAKAAERAEKGHVAEALQVSKQAEKIEAKATGPDADLARVRSLHGATSTLRREWQVEITNRNALPRDVLWPFINEDELRIAARKWMLNQPEDKRQMPGTRMENVTIGEVR